MTSHVSEYEKQRLENIRQNREMLMSLNLIGDDTSSILAESENANRKRKITVKNKAKPRTRRAADDQISDDDDEWSGIKRQRRADQPARRSRRLRGESAEPTTAAEEQVVETGDVSGVLADAESHFPASTLESAIRVNGHYSGWVEPGVQQRLHLESNATAAWESQGGGKFSFKDPLGTGKRVSKRTVPSGQSVAKYVASKLLKKNPNAYFYRHTEPGVEQWTGDWTEDERLTFIRVAKEFGCGDKWGLFSTYIPHRVGYQCSNYYRQYVIPSGWIIDDNYRIDSTGHAVYVGKHKRGS
ncbi:hypothetical protein IWW36_001765 [Coemansia brasiliensis]|uniref:Myb-like domain-containing protein n=1 Tax=Coemansia brasiliensis TaxID=2650707 RepID=A0A9W8ID89_9FUNG|nr:hypothetical protein IWW36_001765 [Coemansia brasiliensis]